MSHDSRARFTYARETLAQRAFEVQMWQGLARRQGKPAAGDQLGAHYAELIAAIALLEQEEEK